MPSHPSLFFFQLSLRRIFARSCPLVCAGGQATSTVALWDDGIERVHYSPFALGGTTTPSYPSAIDGFCGSSSLLFFQKGHTHIVCGGNIQLSGEETKH